MLACLCGEAGSSLHDLFNFAFRDFIQHSKEAVLQ